MPHYLPGANPYLTEFPKLYNLPMEAARGGAETTYPEYGKELRTTYKAPDKCTVYCCGGHHAGDDEQLAGGVPRGRPAGSTGRRAALAPDAARGPTPAPRQESRP